MAAVDFALIGAPHAGVRMLGELLSAHPALGFPRDTNASVWVDGTSYEFSPEWFQPGFFSGPEGALRGMINPGHMSGIAGCGPGQAIEQLTVRMAAALPDVKLIALLGDPLVRAAEHHRIASECGLERRSLTRALREQLAPAALAAARAHPRIPTGYITWGEYGRILEAYRRYYPRSQLLVLYRSEFEDDTTGVLSRVADYLRIDDRWPVRSEPASQSGDLDELPDELRRRLVAHYAADAQRLQDLWVWAPWSTAFAREATAEQPAAPRRAATVTASGADADYIADQLAIALEIGDGFVLSGADTAEVARELLGIDRIRGLMGGRSVVAALLSGRPLALIGPPELAGWISWRQRETLRNLGLDFRVAIGVGDDYELRGAFASLAAQREAFDAILVVGDTHAPELCTRLASELGAVTLAVGHVLDRTLDPRAHTAVQTKALDDIAGYVRGAKRQSTRRRHRREGQLVRVKGEAAVYFVEDGKARPLPHRAMVELFDTNPVQIERAEFEQLEAGIALFAVRERFAGNYLAIGGTRRPVAFGLPLAVLDDPPLTSLARDDEHLIHWYPGADAEGIVRRR